MVKLEWGTKRLCAECNIRFYDLKKDPAVCPKCGGEVSTTPPRGRAGKKTEKKEVKAAPAQDGGVTLSEDTSGEEEGVLESVDELGEDSEDIPDVAADDGDDE